MWRHMLIGFHYQNLYFHNAWYVSVYFFYTSYFLFRGSKDIHDFALFVCMNHTFPILLGSAVHTSHHSFLLLIIIFPTIFFIKLYHNYNWDIDPRWNAIYSSYFCFIYKINKTTLLCVFSISNNNFKYFYIYKKWFLI